ncbi:hypothetical protein [Marinobacterium mangrovicola]|uniref:hypothetical protein n=1 Tax=Marinobacterium mangrovicola TaxID=1476959 RepID=UPI0010469115|nr:hypothetical protein [Marinobacterium mangrovicola]
MAQAMQLIREKAASTFTRADRSLTWLSSLSLISEEGGINAGFGGVKKDEVLSEEHLNLELVL